MDKAKEFASKYKGKENKKDFIKKFKKSIDFKTYRTSIDAQDQLLAESTSNPDLIEYLGKYLNNTQTDIFDIPMAKGILKMSRKDRGLYSGVMTNENGEVIEKFDEVTIPILAKNLEIKDMAEMPMSEFYQEELEHDIEAESFINEYKEESPRTEIKIRCGDIEIEIKKSIQDFVKSFKSQKLDNALLKSLKSLNLRLNKKDEKAAARELLDNWEMHKEDFFQRLHGIKLKYEEK